MNKMSSTNTLNAFLLTSSRTLERAAYFGIRAMLFLYLIGETIGIPTDEAIKIYSWAISAIIVSQVIGALLGDFLLGDRKAYIIGCIIQTVGIFILCIPNKVSFFIGLGLVIIGSGLYTPNIMAGFGKIYLDKPHLLDAGFTFFYSGLNIGSVLGVLTIAYLGKTNFSYGFLLAGTFMLAALVLLFFSKKNNIHQTTQKYKFVINNLVLIFIAILGIALFFGIYEIFFLKSTQFDSLISEYFNAEALYGLDHYLLISLFLAIVGISLGILWSFVYNSQLVKLIIGFLITVASFGILLAIPEIPTVDHIKYYVTFYILISLAELCIVPIVHSLVVQYSNPKYLALMISIIFIPIKIFSIIVGIFLSKFNASSLVPLVFSAIVAFFFAIILLLVMLLVRWNAKKINL